MAAISSIGASASGLASSRRTMSSAFTAAAGVSGVPSWNVTPGSSSNVQVRPSFDDDHSDANPGASSPSRSAVTRVSATSSRVKKPLVAVGSRLWISNGPTTRSVSSVCSFA